MGALPLYISFVFILTTFLVLWIFYLANRSSVVVLGVLSAWLVAQGFGAYSGFYLAEDTLPPRFLALVGPALLVILLLFITKKGRKYMDGIDVKYLTWLHIMRLPVEIVLFWLFMHQLVPQLMTFEGRNFDIISGISAPFVAYFGYSKIKLNRGALLLWNFICLALLLNIVINAVLSAPFVFQQFAFDQPNVAVLYFPFAWLPGFIVPVVLFSHLVCIRQLAIGKK